MMNPLTLDAQAKSGAGFMMGFGYSRTQKTYPEIGNLSNRINTADIAAGLSVVAGHHFIGIGALDLNLYKGIGNPRYYIDTFSNGQSRCRDSRTGQFADTSLCNTPVEVISAGMFDGNITVKSLMAGAGYRKSSLDADSAPYASIGLGHYLKTSNSLVFFRVIYGKTVAQAQLGFAAHWPK